MGLEGGFPDCVMYVEADEVLRFCLFSRAGRGAGQDYRKEVARAVAVWTRCSLVCEVGDHASYILVASALGIGGRMREKAMSCPSMSKRRCMRMEMFSRCVCVASPRRGACRKAVMAAWHPSSADVSMGAVCGTWRGGSPSVCEGSDAEANWVIGGLLRGPWLPLRPCPQFGRTVM